MQYQKIKDVEKIVLPKGETLSKIVLQTMKTVTDIVGATLGPGGQPVLIERQELNLPSLITKDGVTVFRSLGFSNAIAHEVMAAARDASVRTASEAGDGTTTATILAEAIVRLAHDYCKANPRVKPQRVVRRLEWLFKNCIEPEVRDCTVTANMNLQGGKTLRAVAKVSANGDEALADAVMDCFRIVGDDGNVTILEQSGPSSYRVERLEGYPIPIGYEDSCAKYFPAFINDQGNSRVYLQKPVFVLYQGSITEMQTILKIMEKIGSAWQDRETNFNHNVVLAAFGFSDTVLGQLAMNFAMIDTINVMPLVAPKSMVQTSQLDFLHDLAAVTGARVFDPLTRPLETAELSDLGYNIQVFEAYRYRSTIVGRADPDLVLDRVDMLQQALNGAPTIYEKTLLEERIGKLTGGIAKLIVTGASNGELREKRDRAEDAVCAVRGAIRHGVLPGGGWMLIRLALRLAADYPEDQVAEKVLGPALLEPFSRLLKNVGLTDEEGTAVFDKLAEKAMEPTVKTLVYDCMDNTFVNPFEAGLLDSTPAVLEAIRNSLSVAALLGTLGGTVVFKRDRDLELQEAKSSYEFERMANDTMFDPNERV